MISPRRSRNYHATTPTTGCLRAVPHGVNNLFRNRTLLSGNCFEIRAPDTDMTKNWDAKKDLMMCSHRCWKILSWIIWKLNDGAGNDQEHHCAWTKRTNYWWHMHLVHATTLRMTGKSTLHNSFPMLKPTREKLQMHTLSNCDQPLHQLLNWSLLCAEMSKRDR